MKDILSTNRKGQPGSTAAALSACDSAETPRGDADAPAAPRNGRAGLLATVLVAVALTGIALAVDAVASFPLWFRAVLWVPLTVGAVLAVLQRGSLRGQVIVRRQNHAEEAGPDPEEP